MRILNLFTRILYVAKRKAYALRLLIPGLRRIHKLEVIVGPRGYWYESRKYQLEVLKQTGLLPEHKLLDFGCGPLQGGVAFIGFLDRGRYFGLDNTRSNLDAANSELAHHRLADKNPVLIWADDFGAEALEGQSFDRIWASQILYYFDEKMLKKLFEQVALVLETNGAFLFDIVGECPPEFKTVNHVKWMDTVNLHSIDSIRSLAEPLGFRVRSLGEVQDYGYPRGLNLRANILIELTRA